MAAAVQRETLRSQWLGQELRQLRDAKGMQLKEVAEYLQRNPATVSRYETGFYPIRRVDMVALMDLYGVSDPARREKLLNLSRHVWQRNWWDGYLGDVAGSLIDYVWLEARAERIRSVDQVVMPGLLQSHEYAESVIRSADPDKSPEQIDRWLELRTTRQRILDGADPPQLSVIVDEAVLRREVGSPQIMADQLRHLLERSARPTIEVRVLPLRAGRLASTRGTFAIFQLPEPFPEVAYTETLAGGVYVEAPGIESFVRAYDGHSNLALGPADSAEFISAIAEEWR